MLVALATMWLLAGPAAFVPAALDHTEPADTPAPAAGPETGSGPGVAEAIEPAASSPYPMEIAAPFEPALFHWVDSLAGTSGGKTIPIYQLEFTRRFGDPGPGDLDALRGFRMLRAGHAAGLTDGDGTPRRGSAAMLGVFLEYPLPGEALERLSGELDAADLGLLETTLGRFRERYRLLWNEARYLPKFAEEMNASRNREVIEGYLAELARFFGVSSTEPPRPRIVLVPVPGGGGTHAQAVGRDLLLEIRPDDTPLGQISVIAHENSHFLFERIDEDRLRRLRSAAVSAAPDGERIWGLLREALPTALGQGIAESRIQPRRFSRTAPWYHVADVDRLAKRIFPIVDAALREGRPLDEAMIAGMIRAAR